MSAPTDTQRITTTRLRGHGVYAVHTWQQLPIVHGFGCRNRDLTHYLGNDVVIPETIQIHGTTVHQRKPQDPALPIAADAFITEHRGLVCSVRTADCVPILLYDPIRKICGAIHAGWRGLSDGIIAASIDACCTHYRCQARNIQAAIGPCIGIEQYEVGESVLENFTRNGFDLSTASQQTRPGHAMLDLTALATQALQRAGVQRIYTTQRCTYQHQHEFHSFRREPGNPGRQWSFIVMC